jgi:uncharacterized phage protein (TIGR01671 family)
MTREIKFRAWDNYSKSFINDDEYLIGLDGKFYRMDFYSGIENYEDGNLIWNELDNITLSQFTGLLDKNGKEIYEGDIVEYIERLPIFPEKRLSLVQFIGGNVDYANNFLISPFVNIGSFNYETNCITGTLNNPKESIVIGNIYENPELLTEK